MERSKFTTKSDAGMDSQTGTKELACPSSEHQIVSIYTCLINQVTPGDVSPNNVYIHNPCNVIDIDAEEIDLDEQETIPLEIERIKGTHKIEVIEECSHENIIIEEEEPNPQTDNLKDIDLSVALHDNLNILKLTRMKWLTEGENSPDKTSFNSQFQYISNMDPCDGNKPHVEAKREQIIYDKHLSTIIELDKEHNLFGLANISILNDFPLKRNRKIVEGPLFPQSAIVLICCGTGCCKHKSKSDLPASLKCGSCGGCGGCGFCLKPSCTTCGGSPSSCKKPCPHIPSCPSVTGKRRSFTIPPPCSPCPPCPPCRNHSPCPAVTPKKASSPCPKCAIPIICPGNPCKALCSRCCTPGCALKIVLNKKPKYVPTPVEIASRASSQLKKPQAARVCTHTPHCIPPSSCFSYLMPCYWPATESAPCSNPERCFHNPPCPAPKRKGCPDAGKCPVSEKCGDANHKCVNHSCPGGVHKEDFGIKDHKTAPTATAPAAKPGAPTGAKPAAPPK